MWDIVKRLFFGNKDRCFRLPEYGGVIKRADFQNDTRKPRSSREYVHPAFRTKAASHRCWKILSRKGADRSFNDPEPVFWYQHEVLRSPACDMLTGATVT